MSNYFVGGYYLVEGSPLQTWMNSSLLPQKLYSISTHISKHHPYLSLLSWVDESDREVYRSKLRLDRDRFAALQIKTDRWFDLEQYGWAGVWLDPDIAREFAIDYLSHREDLKLNQYGLIDRHDLAIQATDYINLPKTGAEPLLWQPWAIIESEI